MSIPFTDSIGVTEHTASESPAMAVGLQIPPSAVVEKANAYEQWSTDLRESFESGLEPGFLANYAEYKRVEVLLLSWETKQDDLKVKDEILDLHRVFKDMYNFNCEERKITPSANYTAQIDLNFHVISWVRDRDPVGTLFIIYFAGHGTENLERPGELILHGNQSALDVRSYLNKVVWNRTEEILRDVRADVLQIFDCCYAGKIGTRSENPRRMEFLAASDGTTRRPGKESFTRALIWALDEFYKSEASFTTTSLARKIKSAPNFPENQQPLLKDRIERFDDGKILLRPLKSQCLSHKPSVARPKHDSKAEVVTLKFVFSAKPTNEEVRVLAESLCHVVRSQKMSISCILWAGVGSTAMDALYKAASRLSVGVMSRRKSSASMQSRPQLATATVTDNVRLSEPLITREINLEALEARIKDSETLWRLHAASPTVYLFVLLVFTVVVTVHAALTSRVLYTAWLGSLLKQTI